MTKLKEKYKSDWDVKESSSLCRVGPAGAMNEEDAQGWLISFMILSTAWGRAHAVSSKVSESIDQVQYPRYSRRTVGPS